MCRLFVFILALSLYIFSLFILTALMQLIFLAFLLLIEAIT